MRRSLAPVEAIGYLPRTVVGRRLTRVRARLRRRRLDRALAQGADPWTDAELLVRASDLTSPAVRHQVASSLEALVDVAEGRCSQSPYLRVRTAVVLSRRETLRALALRLRDPAPVELPVLALLAVLVWDESSPVYVGGRHPTGATEAADRCLDALADLPPMR